MNMENTTGSQDNPSPDPTPPLVRVLHRDLDAAGAVRALPAMPLGMGAGDGIAPVGDGSEAPDTSAKSA